MAYVSTVVVAAALGLADLAQGAVLVANVSDDHDATAVLMRREQADTGGFTVQNPPESNRKYSSIWGNNAIGTGHARSMLDSPQAWSSRWNNKASWMQMDIGKKMAVQGVYFQARKHYRTCCGQQIVTEAHFEYSKDCVDFTPVEDSKVYKTGVAARTNNKALVKWGTPVVAKCIRIAVDLWESHISTRAGLYARVPLGSDTAGEKTEFLVNNPPENKRTYSSVWGNNRIGTGHARSMLDSPQGWSARWNNDAQWMTMDMTTSQTVNGVYIQARNLGSCCGNQIVTAVTVEYSKDCIDYTPIDNGLSKKTGVHYNTHTKHLVKFSKPVIARCVKVHTDSWVHHVSMRAALSARAPNDAEKLAEKSEFMVVNPKEAERSYSSIWGNNRIGTGHARSRLDSPQAWSARWNNKNQWMIIKLINVQNINGAWFQSRNKGSCCGTQMVTQVQFDSSEDCVHYTPVDNGKVFATGVRANTEAKTFVKWSIEQMVKCVKIKVVGWHHHISMRAGLSGGALQAKGEETPDGYLQQKSALEENATAVVNSDGSMEYEDGEPVHVAEDFPEVETDFSHYEDGSEAHTAEDFHFNETSFDFYGDGQPMQID